MTDVIIVGAGIAGLGAALELKKLGVSYLVLEAANEPGGRAVTHRLPSGTPADLGAHWLHGDNNPMRELLDHYGIGYRTDKAKNLFIYQHGDMRRSSAEAWLDQAVDSKKAKRIETGKEPDAPISVLAADENGRQLLKDFALMWNGLDPSLEPSALEFLTEKSTPGGLQPDGGMGALIGKLAGDVGHIELNSPVTSITTIGNDVQINGTQWRARKLIFTGSLAVIQSGIVAFEPGINDDTKAHLGGLAMGKMNKIIIELDAAFFDERNIAPDTSIELLDAVPPHFCHVRSAGLPLINLFVSGPQAARVELMNPVEALLYASRILSPVKELQGFEKRLIGRPLVSHWVGNPYTQGAYSSCLPGSRRTGPLIDGHLCFAGDSFDEDYPASFTGAWQSGQAAAQMIAKLLV